MNLFLWGFIALVGAAATFWLILLVRQSLRDWSQTTPDVPEANDGDWVKTKFIEPEPFTKTSQKFEDQNDAWKNSMSEVGQQLKALNIGSVTLVHGTFVGTDPFDILRLSEVLIPGLAGKIRKIIKFDKDQLFNDSGHFSKNYLNLIRKSFDPTIKCNLFEWTSGNHHIARVLGSLDLLNQLTSEELSGSVHSSKIILLIGHSHAGQLFALITQMINDRELLKNFGVLASAAGSTYTLKSIENRIKMLSKRKIYFVTLGTPPRYRWFLNKRIHAIHLINHRCLLPEAGGTSGLLTTRDGDYVQQWGISGSDSLSPIKKHQELNKQLDQLLEPGFNLKHWQRILRLKKRIHPLGLNYLVDYGDDKKTPNCISTIFGHGIYTRSRVLLYNMKLIAKHFSLVQQGYSQKNISEHLKDNSGV